VIEGVASSVPVVATSSQDQKVIEGVASSVPVVATSSQDQKVVKGGASPDLLGKTISQFKKRAIFLAFGSMDIGTKDGKLSLAELIAGSKKLKPPVSSHHATELFKAMDTNSDGSVSPREFFDVIVGGSHKKSFVRGILADSDKEKKDKTPSALSLQERYALWESDSASLGSTITAFQKFSLSLSFGSMDITPKDGKLNLAELVAGGKLLTPPVSRHQTIKLKMAMDTNNDGAITPREFSHVFGKSSVSADSDKKKKYDPKVNSR